MSYEKEKSKCGGCGKGQSKCGCNKRVKVDLDLHPDIDVKQISGPRQAAFDINLDFKAIPRCHFVKVESDCKKGKKGTGCQLRALVDFDLKPKWSVIDHNTKLTAEYLINADFQSSVSCKSGKDKKVKAKDDSAEHYDGDY